VDDYDKAIEFYTKELNFKSIEDSVLSEIKRWVVVSPPRSSFRLLLAKAANQGQRSHIGNQTGGYFFFFIPTISYVSGKSKTSANKNCA
jgi:catechol 2,3-dioxygenase-like lactoylglutathione lyase family enzyme